MDCNTVCNVNEAILIMRQIAAPIVNAAQQTINEYENINALCTVTDSKMPQMRIVLRTICAICTKDDRFKELCKLGLLYSFNALLYSLKFKTNVCKLKLVCICINTIAKENLNSFARAAISADLHIALSSVLNSCTEEVSVMICEILNTVLARQEPHVLLNCHWNKCTLGLTLHFSGHLNQFTLLSRLLHCCAACRFILRSQVRIRHIIGHILSALDVAVDAPVRQKAAECLTLLLDSDLPRTSDAILHCDPQFDETICSHLESHTLVTESLSILVSMVGCRQYAFSQQYKFNKLPGSEAVRNYSSNWITLFGEQCVDILSSVLLATNDAQAHANGVLIMNSLCCTVVLSTEQCRLGISAMTYSIHVLVQSRLRSMAKNVLSVVSHLLFNGRVDPQSVHTQLHSIVQRCMGGFGVTFDYSCRNSIFILVPTIASDPHCSICSDVYSTCHKQAVRTHCGHEFCRECIEKWKENCADEDQCFSCPVCRNRGFDLVNEIIGEPLVTSFLTRRHLRESDFNEY